MTGRVRRFAGEAGFLVLVGFALIGAVSLRVAAAVSDARERLSGS